MSMDKLRDKRNIKIVLEYDDGLEKQINPILLDNENFTNLI